MTMNKRYSIWHKYLFEQYSLKADYNNFERYKLYSPRSQNDIIGKMCERENDKFIYLHYFKYLLLLPISLFESAKIFFKNSHQLSS